MKFRLLFLVFALSASAGAVAAPSFSFGLDGGEITNSATDGYLTRDAITNAVVDGLLAAGLKIDFESHNNPRITFNYQQLYVPNLPDNIRIREIVGELNLYVKATVLGNRQDAALCGYVIATWRKTVVESDEAAAKRILTEIREGAKGWATTECPNLK
jgi:hypothetical protein